MAEQTLFGTLVLALTASSAGANRLLAPYGGRVHFDDNHPRGSVVVIELPRADPAATTQASTAEPVDGNYRDWATANESSLDPTDS